MTVDGRVENGQIVLNDPVALPEGMKVRVELLGEAGATAEKGMSEEEGLPTLYERMKSVVGKAEGLPSDYAINHDHYLHGQPKRQ